jgi:hypothetical protein
MLGSQNMIFQSEELKTQAHATYPGMAFFAGTGPNGKCCEDCRFRGYRRDAKTGKWSEDLQSFTYNSYRVQGCEQYRRLTNQHGPEIPKQARSCKYFEDKTKSKRARVERTIVAPLV